MSWGHAVSTDLFTWEHLPVAIPCTDTAGMFSGSAVVDHNNTSGLGTIENPPMVAIYTVHQNDESNQSQHIAYSLDEGITWTKYEGNPVLDLGMKDFRDPKVTWQESTKSWLMTVAKPQEFKIAFFTSEDLINWSHLSDFGPLGATGGIWECPDLFPLQTEDGATKWALIVSLNPGGIAGGSSTQYFVGDWDGREFTTTQKKTLWIDYGRDNYAGVTFGDAPDNRKIFIGWMCNWDYASKLPSPIWRTSMTTPRELQLLTIGDEIRLTSNPIAELKSEHDYSFAINENENVEIVIGDGSKKVVIAFDAATKTISLDRSAAWYPELEDRIQTTPAIELQEFTIRLVLDHGSVELFIPEAGFALTSLMDLPTTPPKLQISAKPLP
jgi:sucrose-6-phosphate hydrolase SacC (GH32 family)